MHVEVYACKWLPMCNLCTWVAMLVESSVGSGMNGSCDMGNQEEVGKDVVFNWNRKKRLNRASVD